MARTARVKAASGIYHVVARGINKQDIFLDQKDSLFYLRNLRRLKDEVRCTVLGYCLMSNHVHLLLREGGSADDATGLTRLMHRQGTVYAQWYNKKYGRVGHVFQGRFSSAAVEDDSYLLAVLRYIHQNPVKAGLATTCAAYQFGSYAAYARGVDPFGIADTSLTQSIMGCRERLIDFFDLPDSGQHEPGLPQEKPTDDDARALLCSLLEGRHVQDLGSLSKPERQQVLSRLKSMGGFSLRQLARVTGVSPATILRA